MNGLSLMVFIVGLCTLLAYAGIKDQRKWEAFKKLHSCKIVSVISGSSAIGTGFGANGQISVVPVYIPGKEGWLCDDGITYYRDN